MTKQNSQRSRQPGWTLTETLVCVAIIAVLAAIAVPLSTSHKERAYRTRTVEKLRSLGSTTISYTTDSGGLLPWEDAPGTDDWQAMGDPENSEVWYNALPALMGSPSGAELVSSPRRLYEDGHPLYLPGAPYPSGDKKLGKPYFAIAMNSRLQRKNEEGIKERGRLSTIQDLTRTVLFFERGMPGDKKTNPGQRGFDASPKANPRAFAARYNGKGLLICVDGHVEMRAVSDLITVSGQIFFPQTGLVWTKDPDDDPN